MGQYIYEGHMGGLYCSDRDLDFDDLYCEECGDSDMFLGYARDINDAWELLEEHTATFDGSLCDKCAHDEDSDYCYENCENYRKSGGYDLAYVMNFLYENFKTEKVHYIYLAARYHENENYIFANVQPEGFKFGEKHSLPYAVSIDEKYVPALARALCYLLDGVPRDLKEVCKIDRNGDTVHLFTCIEDDYVGFHNDNWADAAGYRGSSWYGYVEKDKLLLVDNLADIAKHI